MSGLVCITNNMHDIRSCTVKDQHAANCDGWQYAWSEKHERMEATGRRCRGCLPRPARHGLLCLNCWEGVIQALSDWPDFERKIRGLTRTVQPDNGGVRTQSVGWVNLPGTMLAIDEVNSYHRSLWQDYSGVDAWVKSTDGAKDAVMFSRAVMRAERTHQIEEKARPLHRVRCPDCGRLSFVRTPPEGERRPVIVRCQNTACGKTITEADTTIGDENKLVVIAAIERIV